MRGGRRSEGGSTLIEVLVSVVVLGLAITVLLGGMTTTVGSSSLSRRQADAEALLTRTGEAVRDPNVNPYMCIAQNTLAPYKLFAPGSLPRPGGWTVTIMTNGYWNSESGLNGSWQAPCTGTMLQGLTITVTSPGGGFSLSREFVKAPTA